MEYCNDKWSHRLIVFFGLIVASVFLKYVVGPIMSPDAAEPESRERQIHKKMVDRSNSVRGRAGDECRDVARMIDTLVISNDTRELKERFESNPEEVIDALKIKAVENLDSNCSDLLGKMLYGHYGAQDGADYIDQKLCGFVKEWTRIGFGAALLESDRDGFKEYISRMNLCSARDNLVAMAVVEIGKSDAIGSYQLWEKERDAVGAGNSPAKDMMVSKMVENLVQQCDPGELKRLIFSEGFFECGSSEVEQVSLVISQSSPDLALNWAIDRQANQAVRDHIMVDLFKKGYETQGGIKELREHLVESSIEESDAIASISANINRSTAGEGMSYEGLVDRFGWIVSGMPDSETNRTLQAELGTAFARQNPLKALEFATTLSPSRARDVYIDGVVSDLSYRKFEQVSAIIDQISDLEVRKAVSDRLHN